jgi:filamentous hemagglutinin family protein
MSPCGNWLRNSTALISALSMVVLPFEGPAFAQSVLPQGGSVVGGAATISQPSASTLNINQSTARAIINWNSFSVGQSNIVNFYQPNSSSAALNRVTGASLSTIAGQIHANGQVYLINPNGIALTPSGLVEVGGGFVASSLDIANPDFMAGNMVFRGTGASGSVSNQGRINVGAGGFVGLFGGSVSNEGTITVPLGKVGLGSGEMVTLDLNGDGFMQVAVPTNTTASNGKSLVDVAGAISAIGGKIQLTAATVAQAIRDAVNVSGSLSASSLAGRNGSVVLGGGPGGNVKVSGSLDVSGTESAGKILTDGYSIALSGAKVSAQSQQGTGGSIIITAANDVTLSGATIDVSGATGGGALRIGGDFHGLGTIGTAATTIVDAATTIKADAMLNGPGGTVVLWSGQLTSFAGQISGKGGPQGGNGGYVEVSSKGKLDYRGLTDLSAIKGKFGTLLLDPDTLTLMATGPGNGVDQIEPATLVGMLNLANVDLVATNWIWVLGEVNWLSSNALSLRAGTNVIVDAPLKAYYGGKLYLRGGEGAYINAPIVVSYVDIFAGTTSVTAPITAYGSGLCERSCYAGNRNNFGDAILITSSLGSTSVSSNAPLTASGGGSINVSSIENTSIYAPITAYANPGVDGGWIQVYGNNVVSINAPLSVHGGGSIAVGGAYSGLYTPLPTPGASTTVNAAVNAYDKGQIWITSGGDVSINAPVSAYGLTSGGDSGGIYLSAGGNLFINSPITNNGGGSLGGYIYIGSGASTSINAAISGNTTNIYGGNNLNIAADIISTTDGQIILSGGSMSVSQSASSVMIARQIIGNTGDAFLIGNNQVSSFGPFTSSGSVQFTNKNVQDLWTNSLNVRGDLTLATAGNLLVAGDMTANGTVTLTVGGIIAQGFTYTGGVISASTLTGSSAGNATLNSANMVATFGPFTSGGSLSFTNNQTLATTGTLSSTSNLALATATGNLSLAGDLTAGNIVALSSPGVVTQSGGIIAVPQLSLTGGGAFTLTQNNLVGTVAADTSSVNLKNATSVIVGSVGTLNGWNTTADSSLATVGVASNITIAQPTYFGNAQLTLNSGGNININASISDPPSGTLILSSAGTVTQTAPITTTNLLLLGSGGSYALTNPNNSIATLAGNTGTINLTDSQALAINTVAGTNNLITSTAGGVTLTVSAAGGITTTATTGMVNTNGTGPVTLAADAASLGGSVTANGQTVTVQPYTNSRPIVLGGGDPSPGNDLYLGTAILNKITATTLQVGKTSDTGLLTVNGVLGTSSGGALQNVANLTLVAGSSGPGSGGIFIANPINLPLGTLTLFSGSGNVIVRQSAPITASNLSIQGTGGIFDLGLSTGNTVAALTVNTGIGTGVVRLNNDGYALTVGNVTTGTLRLIDSATVNQSAGGTIAASYLALAGGGIFNLTNTNSVGTLAAGGNVAPVSVSLNNGSTPLTIGQVAGLSIPSFSLPAVNMPAVNGVNTGTLRLLSTNEVTQTQPITATNLALTGQGGQFQLANIPNHVETLAADTGLSTGAVVLNNGNNALSIGQVSTGGPTVTGVTTGTLGLLSNNTVTQSQPIVATNLGLLGAGSTFTLTNPNNMVGTVVANTGAVSLTNAQSIIVGDLGFNDPNVPKGLTTSGNITLAVVGSGDITFNNPANAGGALTASTVNGNIIIGPSATLAANGAGNAIVLKAGVTTPAGTTSGGDFINNGGASALSTPNGNWLVYTGHLNAGPDCTGACTVVGGLSPYTAQYSTDATSTPAAGGNYILYRAASPMVLLTIAAVSDSKPYDGTILSSGTPSINGLRSGDSITGLAQVFDSQNAGPRWLTVGGYTIVDNSGTHYSVTVRSAQGTITPAPLTITANSTSKTYGDTVTFAGTEFTTGAGQLKNGETVGSVTLASLGKPAAAPVSSSPYDITATAATGGTFNANNYTVGYVNGALTVNPRDLAIVANPLLEKIVAYGVDLSKQYVTSYDVATKQTVTQQVYSFNGLVLGEALTVNLTTMATQTSPAWTKYPIDLRGVGINRDGAPVSLSNYNISFTKGSLYVLPPPYFSGDFNCSTWAKGCF